MTAPATGVGAGRTARPRRFSGQHNAEVYGELMGLSASALKDLGRRGIV